MTNHYETAKHVLIVEDEPDFAALLCSILVKGGYTVATAYNFEEAFSQVRKARPDVITLDIHMPRKSGVHFYRRLKSNEEFGDIPVVVVTGLTRDDRDMEQVLHAFLETEYMPHPEAYVEKPIDDESHFLRVIQEAIALSTAERW